MTLGNDEWRISIFELTPTPPTMNDNPPAEVHVIPTPVSLNLALNRFRKGLLPNERKKIEVAAIIHATDLANVIWCLENLVCRLNESGFGFVGHSSGYFGSISYASVDHREDSESTEQKPLPERNHVQIEQVKLDALLRVAAAAVNHIHDDLELRSAITQLRETGVEV